MEEWESVSSGFASVGDDSVIISLKMPDEERLDATPIIFESISGLESTPERRDEMSGEFICPAPTFRECPLHFSHRCSRQYDVALLRMRSLALP